MKETRYILNLDSALDEKMLDIINKQNFDLIDNLEGVELRELVYIISPSLELLDNIFEQYSLIDYEVKSILSQATDDIGLFTSLKGEFLIGDFGYKKTYELFQNYISQHLSLHLLDSKSHEFDDYLDFKVIKLSRLGLYLDEFSHFIEKNGGDIYKPRFFLDYLIFYIFHLKKIANIDLPLEVELGASNGSFYLNVALSCEGFTPEALWRDFSTEKDGSSHLKNLLNMCDFFEYSFLESPEKMNIFASWEANETLNYNFCIRTLKESLYDQDEVGSFASDELIESRLFQFDDNADLDDILVEEGLSLDDIDESFFGPDEQLQNEASVAEGLASVEESFQKVSGQENEELEQSVSLSDQTQEEKIQVLKSAENIKRAELIHKVSNKKDEKEFISLLSSSFRDEMKDEIIRIGSAGSEEKLDIMKVLLSVTQKAQAAGLLKGGGAEYMNELISNGKTDQVLSLLSFESIPVSETASFLDGSKDSDKEIIDTEELLLVTQKVKDLTNKVKKAEVDSRNKDILNSKDIQKLERNLEAKDQQIFNLQKNYTLKAEASQAEIERLKGLVYSKSSGVNSNTRTDKTEGQSLEASDQSSTASLKRKLDSLKKSERAKSRESTELRKQVSKLTAKLKEQTMRQSKKGALSMREKVLEGNLKQVQNMLSKLKKENTLIKQKMMAMNRKKS